MFASFEFLVSRSVIAGFRSCWNWAGLGHLIIDIWQVLMTFLVEDATLYHDDLYCCPWVQPTATLKLYFVKRCVNHDH